MTRTAFTDTQWDAFAALVEAGWPGTFDDATADSWRILLNGIDPPLAIEGLRRLLYSGKQFYPRPAVSDLLAAIRKDPDLPTFEEAWEQIEDALKLRGYAERRRSLMVENGSTFLDENTERGLREDTFHRYFLLKGHPKVRSFALREGRINLLQASYEMQELRWGSKRRQDMKDAWERFLSAEDEREVAALASGRNGGLRRLEPMKMRQLPEPAA